MFKKLGRRMTAVTLVILMVVALLPMSAFAATATSSVTLDTYGIVDDEPSGSQIVVNTYNTKAQNYIYKANSNDEVVFDSDGVGTGGLRFRARGTTVEYKISVQNSSSRNLIFNLSSDANCSAELSSDSDAGTSFANGLVIVPAGRKLVVDVAVKSSSWSYVTTSNYKLLRAYYPYSLTVKNDVGGTVTADGVEQADSEYVYDVTFESGITLGANVSDGYEFFGFLDETGNFAKVESDGKIHPLNDMVLTPVYLQAGEALFYSSGIYRDFQDALDAADLSTTSKTVVVLGDYTLDQSYTVPRGVTLLVPNDNSLTLYTTQPNIVNSNSVNSKPSTMKSATGPYVTLTVPAGCSLNIESGAAVSLGGTLFSPNGGGTSQVTGTFGHLAVEDGARVCFLSGSFFYAWGFATGKGEIFMEDGSVVYEDFQINDFCGGTLTGVLKGDSVFPFNQYYVQNVECIMHLAAGAQEWVYGSITVSGSLDGGTDIEFVGPSGLFRISEGEIIKYYDIDQDKVIYIITEDTQAEISPIPVTISALNMSIDIQTEEFQMPICNFGVEVQSGAVLEINQDLQLLPDSYVIVDQGAQVDINAQVYLIDNEDWDGGKHVHPNVNRKPNMYSQTRKQETGSGESPRSKNGSTESAMMDINGVVNINEDGALVATAHGAAIISSDPSGDTAVNNYSLVDPDDLGLAYVTFNGSEDPPRGIEEDIKENCLMNDNDTYFEGDNDDTYTYDTEKGCWRGTHVTVTWVNWNGNELTEPQTVDYDTVPVYSGATPTRHSTSSDYEWVFAGWETVDGTQYALTDTLPTAVTKTTYQAYFTQNYITAGYTVTWEDEDGTVLETDEDVAEGTLPTYDGETPTKADDELYTYTFAGWTPAVSEVSGDATYTATYDSTYKANDYFAGWSLSLQGDILLNFYFEVPDAVEDYTLKIQGEEFTASYDAASGLYKASYPVKIAEMTEQVVADLFFGDTLVDTEAHKAADYGTTSEIKPSGHCDDTALVDAAYYLVGSINGIDSWTAGTANPAFKFIDNPNNNEEYYLPNVTMHKGDQIKIAQYFTGSNSYGWYPDGDNNNYIVAETASYNIYMKKDPTIDTDGWHYGKFYVEKITEETTEKENLLRTLVQSTLNYGQKAQINWGKNTDDQASTHISEAPYFGTVTAEQVLSQIYTGAQAVTIDDDVFAAHGMTYMGSSLVLNEDTSIKHYFRIGDGFDPERVSDFSFGGLTVGTDANAKFGYYNSTIVYFELSGIGAPDLNKRYELKNGSAVISYSALDYVRKVLSNNADDDTTNDDPEKFIDLMYAIYWYNVYAEAYQPYFI